MQHYKQHFIAAAWLSTVTSKPQAARQATNLWPSKNTLPSYIMGCRSSSIIHHTNTQHVLCTCEEVSAVFLWARQMKCMYSVTKLRFCTHFTILNQVFLGPLNAVFATVSKLCKSKLCTICNLIFCISGFAFDINTYRKHAWGNWPHNMVQNWQTLKQSRVSQRSQPWPWPGWFCESIFQGWPNWIDLWPRQKKATPQLPTSLAGLLITSIIELHFII